jgi:non-ribosomal peptide synthetase component F
MLRMNPIPPVTTLSTSAAPRTSLVDIGDLEERDALQNEAAYATRQTIPQELMLAGLMKQAAHIPSERSSTTANQRPNPQETPQ